MYLRDYPKVTLLGGPLLHTHLHRGNCVPELHHGGCQSLAQEHHYKLFQATDFDPGDINLKSNGIEEPTRQYVRQRLKGPEGDFDIEDEEVQTIMSRGQGGQRAGETRNVGTSISFAT